MFVQLLPKIYSSIEKDTSLAVTIKLNILIREDTTTCMDILTSIKEYGQPARKNGKIEVYMI